MMIKTMNDKSAALDFLFTWLVGAGFSGFRFDSVFSLFFYRDDQSFYNENELPRNIEIHLLGDWWIGSLDEWKVRVSNSGAGIEPEEPVKAYELAKLRWTEYTCIKEILCLENVLLITFENGQTLSIALPCDDEYAFMVKESGVHEADAKWSVTFENENYYYRVK